MAFSLCMCFEELLDGLKTFLFGLFWDDKGGKSPNDDKLYLEESDSLPSVVGDEDTLLNKKQMNLKYGREIMEQN